MKTTYGIISCIGLWHICAIITNEIIPFPIDVIIGFIKEYGTLEVHIFASLRRLLIGLIISIILGVHIGLLLGLSKKAEILVMPLIYGIYPIPKAALLPALIILFGIDDLTKILLIIFIVIFPIIIAVKDSVKGIPNEVFYVAKSLSLNRLQMYKDIIIPAILPKLFTTLRLSIGISVAVLYLSENFATFEGLGFYITLYMTNNLKMFTGIFALSLIGYSLFLIVDLLEKRLCKWT